MKKFKKVCLLMILISVLCSNFVFATIVITPDDTTIGGEASNTTPAPNTVSNTIPTTPNKTSNTSNYNNTTNLPKTGADDYLIISVVAVLAIAGIYAYKKINDYKDI